MTTMPGNPYAESHLLAAASSAEDDSQWATAQAILAVAFEQRTVALIHAAQLADDETADQLWVDYITPRLGIGGAQ